MAANLENEIIWNVRRVFQALARQSDRILKPMGLTAADRAVLEILHPDKTMTVPQMARRFEVSRQHIQTTVNRLLGLGLVKTQENPDHIRSKLLCLTGEGQIRFTAILDIERDGIVEIFEGVPVAEKVITERVLRKILERARENFED